MSDGASPPPAPAAAPPASAPAVTQAARPALTLFGRPVPRASRGERIAAVIGVLVAASVLAIALRLNPDPRGVGTHEQLGLPACGLVAAFGVPCPSCGFTTTFTLAAHGRLFAAAKNQPFGLLLFTLTVLAVPAGIVSAARGVSWLLLMDRLPLTRIVLALGGLWILSWAYKWWMVAG